MLRIVLGYRGYSTRDIPVVLYAGHSGTDAQAAVNSAPDDVKRFTMLHNPIERRAKRQAPEGVELTEGEKATLFKERFEALTEFCLPESIAHLDLLSYSDEQFLDLLTEKAAAEQAEAERVAAEKAAAEKAETERSSADSSKNQSSKKK